MKVFLYCGCDSMWSLVAWFFYSELCTLTEVDAEVRIGNHKNQKKELEEEEEKEKMKEEKKKLKRSWRAERIKIRRKDRKTVAYMFK